MHLQLRMRLLPMIAAALFGALSAVGGYTFIYAKGFSYLGHDAAACANCHVMQNHYGAWLKSSHRSVAVCNDCHTPPGFIPKYFTKALNGFNHSLAFTTGRFPEPLRITPRNEAVTEKACRHCHEPVVAAIEGPHPEKNRLSCIRCHSTVGHME
jgi:cytochrome c nitrite reductase small subunit